MTIKGPFAVALLVLLFLSVTANLVIAGFTLGRLAGPRPGGDVERIVTFGTRGFPQVLRDDIVLRARESRDAFRGRLSDVEAARREMFEAMRAEPFDRATLDAAYEHLREATDELQRAGQEIVAEAVAAAPPDVRREIRFRPRGPHGQHPRSPR